MKIALNGASGFVATALQTRFKDCVILERQDDESTLLSKLEGVDIVINLAGAPIIKRWNDAYKQILRHSRLDTTRTLVNAINQSDIKHFISTSAIGIYPNNLSCNEDCEQREDGFLTKLTVAWEREALQCNKNTTIMRLGVVLGKEGGALAKMLTPFRLGLGGTIGDGSMITSWIHITDLVRIYEFIIENRLTGIYNATSPHPVSNRVFTKSLGRILQRPTIFPLPLFVLHLLYSEAASVMTDSKEVYPKALQEAGFDFNYPDIDTALKDILL